MKEALARLEEELSALWGDLVAYRQELYGEKPAVGDAGKEQLTLNGINNGVDGHRSYAAKVLLPIAEPRTAKR